MSFFKDVFSGVENVLRSNIIAAQPIIVNKGADKDIVAGDVNIIELTISSKDHQRKETLIGVCSGIEIYENIHCPGIFCELAIADSRRIYQDFPIILEEYITITFETPNNPGNPTRYVFHIHEVKNRVPNENQKTMSCTIQCISTELITNSDQFVDKAFNDNISDIVKNIMEENIKSNKKIEIEKTIGIDKYPNFNLKPFQAINSLLKYSISDRYQSHAFVFFENKHGYHYTTYEKLIERGRKQLSRGLSDKEFFYDTARKERIEDVNIRNIIAYNQIGQSTATSNRSGGGYVGTATSVDPQTAGQRTATSGANIALDSFQKMDEGGASPNSTNEVRVAGKVKRPTAFNLIPIFSNRSKAPLVEAFATRMSFLQFLTTNITQIHVYGDSDLTVGDMIKCTFPSSSSFDDETGVSRLDSGNYLITKLRHIILLGDRPQHTISLEIVKNNLLETS
jgi:hypothetical protein